MKRSVLAIAILLALILCGCSARAPDYGESAAYESYVAYCVGDYLMDTIGDTALEPEIDVLAVADESGAKPSRTINYGGVKYRVDYVQSYVADYNTVLDEYDNSAYTENREDEVTFKIGRKTGEVVGVYFSGRYMQIVKEGAGTDYEKKEFYVNIAKGALDGLVDVDDYEISYVLGSLYGLADVTFKKNAGEYLMTSASVYMTFGGEIIKIATERDFNWGGVNIDGIDSERIEAALVDKLRSFCVDYSVKAIGYNINHSRIVADKNGRPAVYMVVSTKHDENSLEARMDKLNRICAARFYVYLD